MNNPENAHTCEWVQDHVIQYEDGELDSQLSQRVELHLRSCARCTAEAAAYAQLNEVLHQAPEVDISPTFAARVVAEVRRRFIQAKSMSFADWWESVRIGWRTVVIVGSAVALAAGFILGTSLASSDHGASPNVYFGYTSLTDTYQNVVTAEVQR